MNRALACIFALQLITAPARAQDYDRVSQAVTEQYASAHFCDRPRPKADKGDIVIWWERDSSGKCTVQRTVQQ